MLFLPCSPHIFTYILPVNAVSLLIPKKCASLCCFLNPGFKNVCRCPEASLIFSDTLMKLRTCSKQLCWLYFGCCLCRALRFQAPCHLGDPRLSLSVPRFEKLALECMKSIGILKDAHAKGQPVPKCRTEERTINTFKSATN